MVLTIEETEEAIYQITRAVFEHLGEHADRRLVEALVSDIFGALRPLLSSAERSSLQASPPAEASPTAQRFIISVFGLDRPGIVAAVATLLADANCSIIDMNQTVVQGKFAMVMIVDASQATKDLSQLREIFRGAGLRLGVRIYLQREDIFHAMHRV